MVRNILELKSRGKGRPAFLSTQAYSNMGTMLFFSRLSQLKINSCAYFWMFGLELSLISRAWPHTKTSVFLGRKSI